VPSACIAPSTLTAVTDTRLAPTRRQSGDLLFCWVFFEGRGSKCHAFAISKWPNFLVRGRASARASHEPRLLRLQQVSSLLLFLSGHPGDDARRGAIGQAFRHFTRGGRT